MEPLSVAMGYTCLDPDPDSRSLVYYFFRSSCLVLVPLVFFPLMMLL